MTSTQSQSHSEPWPDLVPGARHGDRLALRITGNPVDAEDLAQDTLVRTMRRLPTYLGDCLIRTWAYRIVMNLCLSVRAKLRPTVEDLGQAELRGRSPGPEAMAITGATDRQISAVIVG